MFQIPFSDTKSTLHILGGVSAQIEPAPQETTIYLYKIPVCRGCLVVLIKIADLEAELPGGWEVASSWLLVQIIKAPGNSHGSWWGY